MIGLNAEPIPYNTPLISPPNNFNTIADFILTSSNPFPSSDMNVENALDKLIAANLKSFSGQLFRYHYADKELLNKEHSLMPFFG